MRLLSRWAVLTAAALLVTACGGSEPISTEFPTAVDLSPRSTPALVSGGHEFAAVSADRLRTCGVTTNGDAYCWGSNERGQLGHLPD